MDPDRWQQVKEAFQAAVGLDPARRAALLRERCGGDPELVREVLALLDAYREEPPGAATGDAATGDAAGDETVAEKTGDRLHGVGRRVGPYRLVKVLGEGGMGVVFLAERTDPIRQVVALKLMRAGVGSRQALARFEAERQALALMDHPNVAKVFDAGVDEHDGRPYFVMEYVAGAPITAFCDAARLSVRQRLELFAQACDAVGHAHQKAVIHRDLKPGNILVTTVDGGPVVKVIDFGVAKAVGTGGGSQPLTRHTADGQWVGTPEYMSPEQTGEAGSSVDTRTDVYSLGVVLYELLTGCLPLDGKLLRGAPAEVAQRMIRESDAPRPSTRFGGIGDTATEVAGRRSCTARTLSTLLRRELEWIPMKAVRKRPEERYASVAALAADVRNYLAGRPLEAGPESGWYRARKLLSRHRGKTAAVTAVVASLALGFAGTYWMMRRAAASLASEKVQRRLADERFELAEKRRVRSEHDRYAAEFRAATQSAQASHGVYDAIQILDDCDPALRGWEWAHLRRRLTGAVTTLQPPEASWGLGPVALSADGNGFSLVGHVGNDGPAEERAGADGDRPSTPRPSPIIGLWAWDGTRWSSNHRLQRRGYGDPLAGISDPAGRRFAQIDDDKRITVCDTATGRVLWSGQGTEPPGLMAASFSADGELFVCTRSDGRVIAVRPDQGTAVEMRIDGGEPSAVAISPDQKKLAVGTTAGVISILDVTTGKTSERVQADHRRIFSLRYSTNSSRLLCCAGALFFGESDYPASRPGNVIVLETDPVRVVDSMPCSALPLDADYDAFGVLTAVTTGGELQEWGQFLPNDRVSYPSKDVITEENGFSFFGRLGPDSRTAVRSLSSDVQIIDRDVARGFRRLAPPAADSGNAGEIIRARADGAQVLVRFTGNVLGQFDLRPGAAGRATRVELPGLNADGLLAMSPDGAIVAVAEASRVRLLEWPSCRQVAVSEDLPERCQRAMFSADGKTLWAVAAPVAPAPPHTGVRAPAPKPDSPNHLLALDAASGRMLPPRRTFRGGNVSALAVSADGRWIAVRTTESGTFRTRVEVMDAAMRTVLTLPASQALAGAGAPAGELVGVGAFDFAPQGGILVVEIHLAVGAGAADSVETRNILRQYRLPDGKVAGAEYGNPADANLRGEHIDAVRYSPNMRRIVTGGHKLRVWDAASGQPLLALEDGPGRSEQFRSFRFLPDGSLIATNDNGSLYVFASPAK